MNATPEILTQATGSEVGTWHAPYRLCDAALASKSAATRATYTASWLDFARFLDCADIELALQKLVRLEPGPANTLMLAYQESMIQRELAPATANIRLASLRSVVRTARRLGITALFVDVPGLRSEAYRDLSGPPIDVAAGVLRRLASDPRPKGRRDYCMVRLAIALGLRRNEILSLDVEHVDLTGSKLWILAKGYRERRAVTIPPQCLEALRRWIDARGDQPGPLFYSFNRAVESKTERLSGRGLWGVVTRLGLGRIHGLRHLSVTQGLNLCNGDVRKVRQHSRHQSIDVLLKYDDARSDQGGAVARLIDASLDAAG
jgi:integrase/recombinase XerC